MKHISFTHAGNPVALILKLTNSRHCLAEQRLQHISLLTWMELVRAGCHDDPALVSRLIELRASTPDAPHGIDVKKAEEIKDSSLSTLLDLVICRYVDDSISFFRDAAAVAMAMNPEHLRSQNKQLSLNEVLGFRSMADLVGALAARKSQELSRDDFQLLVFCAETLGLPVFSNTEDRTEFKWAIRTRNVLVHNAGKIDERYVKALKLRNENIGIKVTVTHSTVFRWMDLFNESSERVTNHIMDEWHSRFQAPEKTSDLPS